MAKMLGHFVVTINGERKRSKKGASLSPGGAIKKAVMATTGFCGHHTDEFKPATAKFKLAIGEDDNIVDLQGLSDVTLVFEGDDGKSYLIRQAAVEGEVTVTDGEADMTMTGAPAEVL